MRTTVSGVTSEKSVSLNEMDAADLIKGSGLELLVLARTYPHHTW